MNWVWTIQLLDDTNIIRHNKRVFNPWNPYFEAGSGCLRDRKQRFNAIPGASGRHILGHIIFNHKGYYSFLEQGDMTRAQKAK